MKSEGPTSEGPVKLSLSRSEALVLFEFLSRFSAQKTLEIQDPAEQRVLWDLQAELERVLSEPLARDYEARLQEARKEVGDEA